MKMQVLKCMWDIITKQFKKYIYVNHLKKITSHKNHQREILHGKNAQTN